MPPLIATAFALVFPTLVLIGAARDAMSFTIPNWVSLGLLGVFPLAALALGLSPSVIALHFGVGAAALVLGMVAFAVGWFGGGDAKLAAGVALWLGWPAALTFLLFAALAGGVLAIALILLRSAALRTVVLSGPRWMIRLAEPGEGVPYGVAIAVGALAAFPASPIMAAL